MSYKVLEDDFGESDRRSLFSRQSAYHPPSQYSFDKSSDYGEEVNQNLQNLHQKQLYARCGSPKWVSRVNSTTTHSGRSPLHIKQLLSPSSQRGVNDVTLKPNALLQSTTLSVRKMPPKRSAIQYYHKPSNHKYLRATSASVDYRQPVSSEVLMGRPTRTSLLRSRERCRSAPINSYDVRRQKVHRQQETIELRSSYDNHMSDYFRNLLNVPVPDNESMHSFLVGARYNRANYLDANCVKKYGIYMPRKDPGECFILRPKSQQSARSNKMRSDSAMSDLSTNIAQVAGSQSLGTEKDKVIPHPSTPHSLAPTTTPEPNQSPSYEIPEAWINDQEDATSVLSKEAQVQFPEVHNTRPPSGKDSNMNLMQEMLKFDDNLNIKGRGLIKVENTRPKSAPSATSRSNPIIEPTPQSTLGSLSSVTIHGQPISRKSDVIDEAVLANDPIAMKGTDNAQEHKAEDIQERLPDETKDDKCVGASEEEIKDQLANSGNLMSGKVRNINAPLHTDEDAPETWKDGANMPETPKHRKGKVRFADEVPHGSETQTDVRFFITEDGLEKSQDGSANDADDETEVLISEEINNVLKQILEDVQSAKRQESPSQPTDPSPNDSSQNIKLDSSCTNEITKTKDLSSKHAGADTKEQQLHKANSYQPPTQ